MFNSKYTGEEVEALLDMVLRGGGNGIFAKTDVVLEGNKLKVRDLITNGYMYLAYNEGTILQRVLDASSDWKYSQEFQVGTGSGDRGSYKVSPTPSLIGVGSIVKISEVSAEGTTPTLYGVAFCDRAYSSWGAIPSIYKSTFGSNGSVSIETSDWTTWQGLSGYMGYMSQSNVADDANDSIAKIKIVIDGKPDFKMYINSFAENGYDYVVAYALDTNIPSDSSVYITDGSEGVIASTKSDKNGAPTTIDNFKEVSYPNDGGEHFIWIVYRRDSSGHANDNRGYILIPNA